ncbi:unnamed protein product [Schistosoma mattheei]|uniref:Uncharacterized protein n=1 Tax=Schistosoma mattheei TaxID=31246 RepID=A0A183P9P2_9TREM|nr:unnamed protein product [Schistosoma mattheei]
MDSIYSSAKAIISRAQPSLDGGIITFTLNNLIKLPSSNNYNNESSSHTKVTIIDHILSTYSRTGYALAIVCALLWIIFLIIATYLTCRQRKRIKKRSETLLYLAPTENHTLNTSRETIEIALHKKHSPKSTFYRTRERLQSNWICLAIQFSLLTILTILLGTAVLLGFAACGQLHTNLVSAPTHEESLGRLLTINELMQTNPEKTHVFPRVLRALAQIRAYLSEFVPQTKIDIEPVVKNLIQATESMQDRMTNEFNSILFNQIGVTEAFQLGDILGEHVVTLITKCNAIVQSNTAFKHTFDRFKVEFQTWLRLINIDNTNNDCIGQCHELRSTFYNNISIRPDSFMPDIHFAIALKFVTTDRNQTAESIQAQLNHGKQLSNNQLEKTKTIMAKQINVPQSIQISLPTRNRIRLGASIGFCILIISIILACLFYLIGGYFYTEGCRYINPEQNIINITEYDPMNQNYIQYTMFPIDAHINTFINRNWPIILSIAKQFTHMPIPHIRSPIYGLLHNCYKNQGILEAFDSIRDYNMKSLNDPQMSNRFINLGKNIMIDSLKSINVNEMFPKETDENLAMASRLDDFIVDYNEVRSKLPKTYLSIQSSIDESNNYTLWPIKNMWNLWDNYYTTILSHRLSIEQLNRLNITTEKIRQTINQLDQIIYDIDQNLLILSKLKKIASHVAKLQETLINLKNIMNNKTILINQAIELFYQNIQLKTPIEAEKLIIEYGPKIMSKVGQCYRLHRAMNDINNAVCHGIVNIFNGFWFLLSWVTLIGTLIIIFSLLLLMHKSPIDNHQSSSSGKFYHRNIKRKNLKSNLSTMVTENSINPNELEALNNR